MLHRGDCSPRRRAHTSRARRGARSSADPDGFYTPITDIMSGYPLRIASDGSIPRIPSTAPPAANGLQLQGKAFQVAELMGFAYAFEQIPDGRILPDDCVCHVRLESPTAAFPVLSVPSVGGTLKPATVPEGISCGVGRRPDPGGPNDPHVAATRELLLPHGRPRPEQQPIDGERHRGIRVRRRHRGDKASFWCRRTRSQGLSGRPARASRQWLRTMP